MKNTINKENSSRMTESERNYKLNNEDVIMEEVSDEQIETNFKTPAKSFTPKHLRESFASKLQVSEEQNTFVSVKGIDLGAKLFRKRQFGEFFFYANEEYFPKLPCFNASFAAQVLQGKKKLMKFVESAEITLPQIKKNSFLFKKSLLDICLKDNLLQQYLPDELTPSKADRDYLVKLLFTFRKDVFDLLMEKYRLYKSEILYKNKNKSVDLLKIYSEALRSYQPLEIKRNNTRIAGKILSNLDTSKN